MTRVLRETRKPVVRYLQPPSDPVQGPTPAEIRGFPGTSLEQATGEPSALKASIDAALLRVPVDVPVALVAHADLEQGVVAGVYVKLGGQFSFVGTLEKRPNVKLGGSAELLWYPGYQRK